VSGFGQPNAFIRVLNQAGDVIGTGTVGPDGAFEIALAEPLVNGEQVQVVQLDAQGNESAPAVAFAPDLTPPPAPVAELNDSGTIVTGTGTPGTTVRIRLARNGVILGSGVVDQDGNFTITLSEPQVDGEQLTVTVTDAAGNESTPDWVDSPDMTAPDAPTGQVSADGAQVSGTGKPGDTITVTNADGDVIGAAIVAADGSYSVTLDSPQTDGQVLTIRQSDASGNQSPPVQVDAPDITAPDAPVATIDANGASISGTGQPGATIEVRDAQGALIGTDTVRADGTYTVALTPAQDAGETLSVTQTDAAGNESASVAVVAPDLTAPDAPTATIAPDGASVSGTGEAGARIDILDASGNVIGTTTVNGDGSYTAALNPVQIDGQSLQAVQTDAAGNASAALPLTAPDTTPPPAPVAAIDGTGTVVTGTGVAGDTIEVRDALGTLLGSATVNVQGNYTVTLSTPQVNGETLSVQQVDPAGNGSTTLPVTAPDITAPDAPTATIAPDGASVTGTGEAGARIDILDAGGNVIGTTTVNGDGSYTAALSPAQIDGQLLQAVQTDAAGNASAPLPLTAPDTTAPPPPTAAIDNTGSIVTGTGVAGATIEVRDPLGTLLGSATVNAQGNYTVTLSTPQVDSEQLGVVQKDAAGNPSTTVPVTAPDLTAPDAPTATIAPDGASVSGTGEAGARIDILDAGGNVIGTTTVNGDGSYTAALSPAQIDGQSLQAVQTDVAGNASAALALTAPDTTPPPPPTATIDNTGSIVTGTGVAGATIEVRDPLGALLGSATVNAQGNYTVTLSTPQVDSEQLAVVQKDAAGNPSTTVPVTAPDLTAPDAPTATIAPDGASVSGTGEAGARLDILDASGNVIGTTTVNGDGTYSAALNPAQIDGQSLQAVQTDTAGNASAALPLTAPDSTPPAAPTATIDNSGAIVTGTGVPGDTIEVRDPLGVLLGSATVNAQGNYTVTLSTSQENGEVLSVVQKDAAGNPSTATPVTAPDITAPDAPTATVAPDGASVSGTGEAGARVDILDAGGNVIGTTTVNGDGSYTAALNPVQIDGQSLQAVQTDTAGNASVALPLTAPDSTPPAAPTAAIDNTGSVVTGTGIAGDTIEVRDPLGALLGTAIVNAQGGYTVMLSTPQENGEVLSVVQKDAAGNPSIATPVTAPDITAPDAPTATIAPDGASVSGTGEAGARLDILDADGNVIGTTTVNGDGSYTATLNPVQIDGQSLQAVQTDAAGNASAPLPLTAPDSTPPAAPTAAIDNTGSVVTGTGVAGDTIEVRDPLGVLLGTATVNAQGGYTVMLSPSQENGEVLSVVQKDPAGNPSTATPVTAPDITAPDAPTATIAPDGASVSGTGEAGARIDILDADGNVIGTTTVNGDGSYTAALIPAQIDGQLLQAIQTDTAGNASAALPLTAPDSTPPAPPTAAIDNTGSVVTGTGVAGDTIEVRDPLGVLLGTATVNAQGNYTVMLSPPQQNGEVLSVVQKDPAGNGSTSLPVTAPDITAPDAPDATIAPDGASVSGTGEAGARIDILDADGNVIGTTTVNGDGSYTATLIPAQTDGQSLQAVQTDGAGNASVAIPLTAPDSTPPDAPTAAIDNSGTIVTGTGVAGDTIEVRDNLGALLGTATVNAQGDYTVVLSAPQIAGDPLSVVERDPAGNGSIATPLATPDLTAPDAPTAIIDANGTTVTGSGEIGATVRVLDATGAIIGSAPVAGDGSFTVSLNPVQDNGQALQVVLVDAVGNISPAFPLTAPDLDGVAGPDAPTAAIDTAGAVVTGTGDIGATITVTGPGGAPLGTTTVGGDGSYSVTLSTPQTNGEQVAVVQSNANGPSAPAFVTAPDTTLPDAPIAAIDATGVVVIGGAEPGATITVRDADGTIIGLGAADSHGNFVLVLGTPLTNGEAISVTQTDAAGNVSPATGLTAPDITAPDAPTGSIANDGLTVTGTGEAGATVTIRAADGTVLGTALVAGDGSYIATLTSAQLNGEALTLEQADAAGNVSPTVPLTAPDSTIPDAPTAQTDSTGTIVIVGAEAGATIVIRDADGTIIGTGTANAQGDCIVTLATPLTNGEGLSVTQTDAGGNVSPATDISAPDITAPDAPSGSVAADGVTVTGTGEAGATVTIRAADGTVLGTALVAGDGSYTATLTTAQLNGEALTLEQADAASNISPTTPLTAPDSTIPDAPTAQIDSTGTIVIVGAEAGATIVIRDADGNVIGTGTANAQGDCIVTLASPLTNGEGLSVTQTDAGGNISPATDISAPDSSAPDAPTGSVAADGVTVTGTGEAGATVTIRAADGTVLGTALVAGDGSYAATLTTAQLNGQPLTLEQADAAGNVSPTVPLTAPDSTIPDAPTAQIDSSGTIVIVGAEAGATIVIRDADGNVIGTGTANAQGNCVVTLATPLTNGEGLSVTQTDAGGNTSPASDISAPDITAPDAPTGSVAADGVTVTGTGEAGATVTIRAADGTVLGTALVAGDGSYTTTLTSAQLNGQALTLEQADTAGNISPTVPLTAPDSTIPDAPTAQIDSSGTIVIVGAEAGATIVIRDADGNVIGTGTANAQGNCVVTLATPLTNGEDLSVTQTDAGGNVSPATDISAPDISAPDAPTGSVAADGVTVTGTGEAGATVTIRAADGTVLGTALVAGDGSYTATLTTAQLNGEALTLEQADAAGNISPTVPLAAPDSTIPDAPTAQIDSSGTIVIVGAEAGATIVIRDADGNVIGTGTANAQGNCVVTLATPLTNGEELSVTQTDAGGNTSPATDISAPDTSAPDAPTGSLAADGLTVTGTGEAGATITIRAANGSVLGTALVAGDGSYTATLTTAQLNGQQLTLEQADTAGNVSPTAPLVAPDSTIPDAPTGSVGSDGIHMTGTGEAGATISITDPDGLPIGTATVGPNGAWSATLSTPQLNGEVLGITQTDPAGNVSPQASATAPDSTAPDAPTGAVANNGASVTGTGEAGATITIRAANGTVLGTAIVAGDGSFTATLNPAQTNGQPLTLTQADVAGNVSPSVPLTAPDSTPPAAPTGTVSSDGAIVTGTGEAGATITIRDPNGVQIGTAIVAANGNWSATLTTPQTNGQLLQITQADPAGNVSPQVPTLAPDSTPPAAPVGSVNGAGTIVSGTGEAGATIRIFAPNGTQVGTTTVAANGNWSATLTTAQTNGQLLQITQTDAAGNVSPQAQTIAPDTTPPAAPTGSVNAVGTIVTGSGEAGATITIRNPGGVQIGTAIVAQNGSWSVTLTTPQTNGEVLRITQADAAGNVSPQAQTIAPDITPPAAPTGSVAANGLTVTGTGEAGATIRITDTNGVQIGTATVAANGNYTVTLNAAQTNGQQLGVIQTDAAGNASPRVQITAPDTTPPDAPTAAISSNGGAVNGVGEAGATVRVTNLAGVVLGFAVVAADGRYTVTLNPAQANGEQLRVIQTDGAGNASAAASITAPDLTPPAAPTASVNANGTIVTGQGEAGARVTILDANGTAIGSAIVAANGGYSVTLTQAQANGQTIGVYQADPTGNVSSTIHVVAPDITPPPPPAALVVSTDGLTLTGVGEAGARVEIRNAGGTLLGSAIVGQNGNFTVTFSTPQVGGQNLSAIQIDVAGNASTAATVGAPFDIAAFDNSTIALIDLLPVTQNVNHGTATYVALVSLGALNLDAQVLSTPNVQFTVAAGHTFSGTFTYDALVNLGVVGNYSIGIQRWNGTAWVGLGASGNVSLLELGVLNGDLVNNRDLGPGLYRAFVTFSGAAGVAILGSLKVTGQDNDFTDIGGITPSSAHGNVITDASPDGHVDVHSPQTVVQSVTVNGVTTAVTANGTVINGAYGKLVIDLNGSYTYTPNANAASIGKSDVFTYRLYEPQGGDTSQANLTISITSDDITAAPVAVNDSSNASVQYANVVQTVAPTVDFTFSTPGTVLNPVTRSGTDSFTIAANDKASVTITVISGAALTILPTYTITVKNAANVTVGTYTATTVAGLPLGSGITHTFADLPSGTYSYTVSTTNTLGTGYGTTVYLGETITHLDQFSVTGVTGSSGELLANDTTGTAFPVVKMATGSGFVEVGDTPLPVTGAYGTLTVNETGGYTYTPRNTLPHSTVDLIDSFTYQIVQPNGVTATARLDVRIDVGSGSSSSSITLLASDDMALLSDDGAAVTSDNHRTAVANDDDHNAAARSASDDVLGRLAYLMFEGQGTLETVLSDYLRDIRTPEPESGDASPLPTAAPTAEDSGVAALATPDDPLGYLTPPDDLDKNNGGHML
jgi:hypothetical protein